ncbi:hypothetical protein C8F04DRAFT_741432 [Mycena alexandri]|uniref:Uncharacterized protein n=1 Tax=Mycena alexandri TaxID=1745969 RepID=A0AAD6WWJ6_9AGAR|nr:hypothetical protein C8F04DRAFT_741432 [Mycena alexandri]
MTPNLSTDLCPKCQTFCLTIPKASTGHYTPENETRVFQKCPRHNFEPDSPCRGFRWRDDLSPPPWGPVMSTPTPASTPASTPTRHSPCVSPHCAAAPKDFAISPSSRLQTEAYRMESKHMIKVKYWTKDDERALNFSVPVTAYPYFHPKDCDAITTKLGRSCTSYDILDTVTNPGETTLEEDDEWVTTSAATMVKPNVTLYLRLPDVKICLGLRSRKRVISEVEEPPTTPSPSPASTPSPTKRARSQHTPDAHLEDRYSPSPSPSKQASSSSHRVDPPVSPFGNHCIASELDSKPKIYQCLWSSRHDVQFKYLFQQLECLEAVPSRDSCKGRRV